MAFTKITHAGIGSTGTVLLENLEVTGVGTFGGSVSVGGTLTYEDVTNVDSVGLITARNGIVVGSGITLSVDGDGFFTGVVTATSYRGDGSNLTGIDLSAVTGATGDFSIADKIVHTGDTDTAIRFPSADTIRFDTGGTEAARITSAQKFVIGDTNTTAQLGVVRDSYNLAEFTNTNADATGAELSLRKDSASPADNDSLGTINFIGDNDAGQKTTYAYIQSKSTDVSDGTEDADVRFFTRGAGTLAERLRITEAGQLLHGHNASIGLGRNFETSSTSGYGGIAINRFSADTGSGGLDFVKSRNASLGGNTIVQSGDNLGVINWRGADGTDFATPAAQIIGAVDGTPGSNDMPGRLVFSTTADGESSVTERLRITSTGKIGITEPSPSNYGIHASQSSESVYYRADSGSVDSIFGSASSLGYSIAGTTSNHALVFFANNAEKLRISTNGQIATRGATGTGFNNAGAGDFGSFLTINGGHTSNQWGILSLEGNTSASGYTVGAIQFINQNNANSSSGGNTQSRLLAKIDAHSVTSDSNAGDDSGGTLRFYTKPEAATPLERLRIASNGYITEAFKPVKTAQDTNVQNISGERFVIDLPSTSRMYRITGSFSFNNGIYRIWGDLGANWSDGHTPSIEGFANWWQDGAGGPTYQDVTSNQYFEVADPVDSGFEVTYDLLLTTMAHNGTARPGVSGNISWTYNGVGRAWTVFSYQDTAASGTDRLTQWAWDIDLVSGTMGTGQHQYVIEQYPITQ